MCGSCYLYNSVPVYIYVPAPRRIGTVVAMPLVSQPPARNREIRHPEPSAPSSSLAVLPEYAGVRSRELTFQLRTWPWTWPVLSINEGDNFWPEAKVLALDGFFRPAGLHWTSNQVQCHFCAVRVDDWEPHDDINEVHVRFTLGRVGAAGYGTHHSQGCLFARHRREHARWEAPHAIAPSADRAVS